jgi:hypothetical protein
MGIVIEAVSREEPLSWSGEELSDAQERATMERLGIDPGLSRRHQLRKLYPFIRGMEKATTEQVETLVTGALQREHARFVAEERRRQRLRRALPFLAALAILLLLVLVLVFVPDLVFLRHA